ncbi:MAG: hypothetical protein IJB09_07945 [Oscillospiraceae bacterium]|nr:hypothetical protein [Oscillospiraceae bacterium]
MIIEDMKFYLNKIDEAQRELDEMGKGGIADNPSRSITHDDLNIYIWKKNDFRGLGIPLTFDYSPDLFFYLARPSKCSYRIRIDDGRAVVELSSYQRAKLRGDAVSRLAAPVGQFAYYYYERRLPAEEFERIFPSIRKMNDGKEDNDKIAIDHSDDNHFINNSWNLSAVTKELNKRKWQKLRQIKPPYFCYPAVCPDGGYRLRFGNTMLPGQNVYVYCPTMEDYIDFLGSVYNDKMLCKHPDFLEEYNSPQHLRATYKTNKYYFAGQFETAEREAFRLLSMPEDRFVVWQKGYNALEMLFAV